MRGDNSMKFTPNEQDVLIEALELLFDERDLDYLPQDKFGRYYAIDPDSPNNHTPWDENYDAQTANTIISLIEKISE